MSGKMECAYSCAEIKTGSRSAARSVLEVQLLRYLLTLPERLLRALAAGLGGLIFEASEVLLPSWLRRSRLYQALVYRLLRLTIELVGDVHDVLPPDPVDPGELAIRKAAGNVIEFASFLAVGWSPLWLLAAASDLTGGTRVYLRTLVGELKEAGLKIEDNQVDSYEELLQLLENSSGLMADTVDVPPLNVRDLRATWQGLQKNARSLPDAARLAELYNQLVDIARQEDRPLASVSGLVAAGALRAGVQLGSVYIFDYYQQAFGAIANEGWAPYALRVTRPYLSTAAQHFEPERVTFTERFLNWIRKSRRH